MSSSDPVAQGDIRAPVRGTSFAALRRSTLFYPLIGLAVVCLIMVFASDSFLSVNNLSNVGRQVSINALIAVGMTFVILTGGIDLSVGSVMALSGTLAAGLMIGGVPAALALVVCLVVGVAFGVFNGALVAYDATTVTNGKMKQLFHSDANPANDMGNFAKYATPVARCSSSSSSPTPGCGTCTARPAS